MNNLLSTIVRYKWYAYNGILRQMHTERMTPLQEYIVVRHRCRNLIDNDLILPLPEPRQEENEF